MWNKPTKEQLAQLPPLYSNRDNDLEDIVIHLHLFLAGSDWYVAEFDGEDVFFGYVNLGDPQNAEWGNFCLSELDEVRLDVGLKDGLQVDNDLHWQPKRFSEI